MKTVFLFLLIAFTGIIRAQSADSIIGNYYKAVGGKENWDKVKTVKIEIKSTVQNTEVNCVFYILVGKAMRSEMTGAGTTILSTCTDTSAWILNPFAGHTQAVPMSLQDVVNNREAIYKPDELVHCKKLNYAVAMKGMEEINDTAHYMLDVKMSDSLTATYFINTKTNLIRKIIRSQQKGKRIEKTVMWILAYKKVGNVLMASSFKARTDKGEASLVDFSKIKINEKMNPQLFGKPKAR